MDVYVLDTHALWWYLTNSKVSETIKGLFAQLEQGNIKFVIPWICLAELYWVMKKYGKENEYWPTIMDIDQDGRFQVAYPGLEDLHSFTQLHEVPEMHDKLIVWTAKKMDIPLVTKDRLIQASGYVRLIWD